MEQHICTIFTFILDFEFLAELWNDSHHMLPTQKRGTVSQATEFPDVHVSKQGVSFKWPTLS